MKGTMSVPATARRKGAGEGRKVKMGEREGISSRLPLLRDDDGI
jgi:hypothetical protein